MGWRRLAELLDGAQDAEPWERSWRCRICGKETTGDGPLANHVREKHPDKLAAARDGWTPNDEQEGEDGDELEEPRSQAEHPSGLEELRERESATADVERPQPTAWTVPGLEDRPQPRRDPPSSPPEEDPDQAPDEQAPSSRSSPVPRQQQMTPAEAAPLVTSTVKVVSRRLEQRGAEPISDQEREMLVDAWSPVVAKYLPAYGEEISALWATVLVLGPRIMDAREAAGGEQIDREDLEDVSPTEHVGDEEQTDKEHEDRREAYLAQLRA